MKLVLVFCVVSLLSSTSQALAGENKESTITITKELGWKDMFVRFRLLRSGPEIPQPYKFVLTKDQRMIISRELPDSSQNHEMLGKDEVILTAGRIWIDRLNIDSEKKLEEIKINNKSRFYCKDVTTLVHALPILNKLIKRNGEVKLKNKSSKKCTGGQS
jgi:hypothetical protein